MKETINVGLLGLVFKSGNKGCSALAYSFLKLLKEAAKENNKKVILNIISYSDDDLSELKDEIVEDVKVTVYHFKSIKSQIDVRKQLKKCDYVFDFTEGDSFSDIYGIKRLLVNSNLKIACINSKIPLILGPQTYGPFNKKISKIIAKKILKGAYEVFARDELSRKYVKELSGRDVESLIDVAFVLPYTKNKIASDKLKLGINISGLLWNNGYTGNNEFNLKVNYKEYCKQLLEKIGDKYEIHLIPHVICNDYNNIENDIKACNELKEVYNECIVAPSFNTPIEAKSYISNMDIFIGARMHSDIAAYSSEVAVIPFSYSRKFEGLFNSLNYSYCINGREMSTEEALEKTLEYINNYKLLQKETHEGMKIANSKINKFYKYILELFK